MAAEAPPVAKGVPVIDASLFLSHENNAKRPPQEVVDQIAHAAEKWGFFQLVNHGVDQGLIDRHFELMKRFFALPASVKESADRSADNALGYFSKEFTKQKLDIKEGFDFRLNLHPELPDDHADNYDPQGVNRWPSGFDWQTEFKEVNLAYVREFTRLSFKLLEVFALSFGLEPHTLDHYFQPKDSSILRLNHYPVDPNAPPGALGIEAHKDVGFLTVLVQDYQVPGLQVLRDGVWHLVEPLQGAFTINIGDIAQVLSNDRYKASNHRVLKSSTRDRYSRAFFFNPAHQTGDITPLLHAKVAGATPVYRPINWREFYIQRLDGNYADLGEEVQIEWYRLDANQGGAAVATGAA